MISIKQIATQVLDTVRKSYADLSYVASDLGPVLVMDTGEYLNDVDQYSPSWDMVNDLVHNYVQGKTITVFNEAYTLKSEYDELSEDFMNLNISKVGSNLKTKLLSVDVANESKFIVNDIKSIVGRSATDFADVLVDGVNVNTVIYDGIETAKQYGSSLLVKPQDANSLITAFASKVQADVPNLKGNAASAFSMLKAGMSNGLSGVLSSVSKLYSSLNTMHRTSDTTFGYTDNTQYQVRSFSVGVLDVVTTIGDLVTTVLAKIHPVIALLTQAITTGIANVSKLLTGALDNYYYASVNTNDPEFYEFPYAVMKGSISKTDYSTIYNKVMSLEEMQQTGAIRIFCPGYSYYLWQNADAETIEYQVRLAADIKINAMDYLADQNILYYNQQGTTATTGDYISIQFQDETYAERWGILYNAYVSNTDLPITGDAQTVNEDLLERFRCAMSFFMMSIFFSLMESSAQDARTFTYNSSAQTQADQLYAKLVVIAFNTLVSDPQDLYATTCRMDDWQYIYINNDTTSQSVIAYFEENFNALTYYPLTSWALFYQILDVIPVLMVSPWWTYAGSMIASVSSLGDNYITIPSYTRQSVISTLIITGITIAAITAVAIISAVKIKRWVQTKRAVLTAQAEKSWDALKSDPSPETYNNYRKAAKANNKFVRIFGGSSLDYNGYWQDTSDQISSVDDKDNGVDLTDIKTLISKY